MSEVTEKTLFFIKSPLANTTAIELFLKKRGFNIISESDLKVAILEIMKVQPDYILIGWDHPSDRIAQLPKLILQSVMTTIIAYSASNNKLHVRRLQASGQPLKLFPPLSGPAIQRLISRLEKDKDSVNTTAEYSKKIDHENVSTLPAAAVSNLIQVKSVFKSEDIDNFMNSSVEPTTKLSEIYLDKGQRAKELRSLQTASKQNFRTPTEHSKNEGEAFKKSSLLFSDLMKSRLNQKFADQIQLPIEEMIETQNESGQATEFLQLKNDSVDKSKTGYCVVVENSNWCGYLIVSTEEGLDPSNLEALLSNWITENLNNSTETTSQLILNCFEIKLYDVAFEKFSQELADYTQSIILNAKKTVLSFFSIDPNYISVQLHELDDMFEISTNEIPISLALPFDLYLYLPENKKFLLYSKISTILATVQIERLKEKKVEKLYSPIENESAIQKFRAETKILFLIEKFNAQRRKLLS